MAYILDENVPEHFEFEVKGHAYIFRYPTTEEVEALSKEKVEIKILEMMYKLIEPKTEGAPPINEAMRQVNTKVLGNFGKMLKKELGIEQD